MDDSETGKSDSLPSYMPDIFISPDYTSVPDSCKGRFQQFFASSTLERGSSTLPEPAEHVTGVKGIQEAVGVGVGGVAVGVSNLRFEI